MTAPADMIEFENSGTYDINPGDIVVTDNYVGVARSAAPAPTAANFPNRTVPTSTRGIAALRGVFRVSKASGLAISAGEFLYYDSTERVITTEVGLNVPAGYAHEDSPRTHLLSGQEVPLKTVLLDLNAHAASIASHSPTSGGMVIDKNVQTALDNLNPRISGSTGSPTAVTAAGGITSLAAVCLQTHFIQGSGGAVNITADPQISAGTRIGQRLVLIGCSGVNTVLLENGTGMVLNGSYTMGNGSVLELFWDGSNWKEICRNGI